MRIGMSQLGFDDTLDASTRSEQVLHTLHNAPEVDLWVLPELWPPGCWVEDDWAASSQPIPGPLADQFCAVAKDRNMVLHAGSMVETGEPDIPGAPSHYNTSVLCAADGSIAATYRKIHLFGQAGATEGNHVSAGQDVVVAPVTIAGQTIPVGLATCYDLRFPELFRALTVAGAELVIIVAAWPAARVAAWELLARARAAENQLMIVAVNAAGTQRNTPVGGHSMVIAPDGSVIAALGSEPQTAVVEADFGMVARARESFTVLNDRRFDVAPGPNPRS